MKNLEDIHRQIKKDLYAEYFKYLNKIEVEYLESKFGKSDRFLKSITLIPHLLYSCIKKRKNTITIRELSFLGFLNIKACVAYTIYDYIHDGKIDKQYQSKLLSLANIFVQHFLFNIQKLVLDNKVLNEIHSIFNTMDKYYFNTKIVAEKVYEKSIGLYIVPCITLYKAGFGINSKESKAFKTLFITYMTARQLSDDLDDVDHDIEIQNNTPAVLMYQKNKDKEKTRKMTRKIIDMNLNKAKKVLLTLKTVDGKKFTDSYIIPEC